MHRNLHTSAIRSGDFQGQLHQHHTPIATQSKLQNPCEIGTPASAWSSLQRLEGQRKVAWTLDVHKSATLSLISILGTHATLAATSISQKRQTQRRLWTHRHQIWDPGAGEKSRDLQQGSCLCISPGIFLATHDDVLIFPLLIPNTQLFELGTSRKTVPSLSAIQSFYFLIHTLRAISIVFSELTNPLSYKLHNSWQQSVLQFAPYLEKLLLFLQ